MKYEIKDFQAWLDFHRDWVIPSYANDTTPVCTFTAENLKMIFEDEILPDVTEEQMIKKSLHQLLCDFWNGDAVGDGGIQPLEAYMYKRCAYSIINNMVIAHSETEEIVNVLHIVLRIGKYYENIGWLLRRAIELYNLDADENAKVVM